MDSRVGEATVHHVEHGAGLPLVALHGAGVDHRDVESAVEPLLDGAALRRVYPDLPGTGRSTADGLHSNDDVVALLAEFVEHAVGEPVLLLGHSYGAYLARGVAVRRPDLVLGLALLCPIGEHTTDVPEHAVVRQDDDAYAELEPGQRAGFDEYFVVRTRATAQRYRDHTAPGTTSGDEAGLGRIMSGWRVDVGSAPCPVPTLIVAGRRDSVVGYAGAIGLLDRYPHATLAVVADAGHALPHERPEVLAPLLRDWVDRTRAGA
jgi:pimeloyl-ACP methyl ester carboxylesterase